MEFIIVMYIVQEKRMDVSASGLGVEIEEQEAGSGGGEDPSSLQLTTADGECVLMCTVCNVVSQ